MFGLREKALNLVPAWPWWRRRHSAAPASTSAAYRRNSTFMPVNLPRVAEAEGFGWRSEGVSFDWDTLRDNKSKEIARLNAIYERLLNAPGVDIITGHGALTGPVRARQRPHLSRRENLLATGTWPALPDIPGNELALTSNEIFDLRNFQRLLIVGGGYIATEFAVFFQAWAPRYSRVTGANYFFAALTTISVVPRRRNAQVWRGPAL
ncbi:MAG: hypothetical protein CM15mP74_36300 [Halieaceae bacterium]|nr:MAG: hypothetical protein CM15mP74_36300 [Halieaceae bacterium]